MGALIDLCVKYYFKIKSEGDARMARGGVQFILSFWANFRALYNAALLLLLPILYLLQRKTGMEGAGKVFFPGAMHFQIVPLPCTYPTTTGRQYVLTCTYVGASKERVGRWDWEEKVLKFRGLFGKAVVVVGLLMGG